MLTNGRQRSSRAEAASSDGDFFLIPSTRTATVALSLRAGAVWPRRHGAGAWLFDSWQQDAAAEFTGLGARWRAFPTG
jgi:hypothetical protein